MEFHKALMRLWELIGETNRYIVVMEPWRLQKEQRQERLDTVLYTLLETLRWVAVLLQPIMPGSAAKMLSQLGQTAGPAGVPLATLTWGGLPPGTGLARGDSLFPRLEMPPTAAPAAAPPPAAAPAKAEVDIAFFQQLDLRIGTIIRAERIAKSDKLLKLVVDVGEPRQVVAGIAQYYRPEDLLGVQVLVVVNLKPAKLMGVESHGMLLAAKSDDRLVLVSPQTPVAPGAGVA
jgi:methionyl-tRNA synthetase